MDPTLVILRDHMVDTTRGFEIVDGMFLTQKLFFIFAFLWLFVLTIIAVTLIAKNNQKRRSKMERSYGKRKEDTGYSGLPATIRELGWSFEVSVKVTGPGGEGPHTIIASQENTHREYAEFIQKGMSDKYAELNEEFKNRG